jgi:predicted O-methyltransferase YrrM
MKWWQPSPSKEIKPVPWLAPAVIQHLEGLVQPDWEIIEHGSGGSTLWFAAHCKSVTAFEHNPDWQQIVRDHAPENAKVLSVGALIPHFHKFDLLLIDGEPVEKRAEWLKLAPELVKPGGWVVLDNANRPEYAAERAEIEKIAAEYQRFNGNEGGTLYLVTDFYRMPEASSGTSNETTFTETAPVKPKRRKKASK